MTRVNGAVRRVEPSGIVINIRAITIFGASVSFMIVSRYGNVRPVWRTNTGGLRGSSFTMMPPAVSPMVNVPSAAALSLNALSIARRLHRYSPGSRSRRRQLVTALTFPGWGRWRGPLTAFVPEAAASSRTTSRSYVSADDSVESSVDGVQASSTVSPSGVALQARRRGGRAVFRWRVRAEDVHLRFNKTVAAGNEVRAADEIVEIAVVVDVKPRERAAAPNGRDRRRKA